MNAEWALMLNIESLNQAYLSKGCRLGALHLRGVLFQRNIDQIHHTYSRHEGRTQFQQFMALRHILQFVWAKVSMLRLNAILFSRHKIADEREKLSCDFDGKALHARWKPELYFSAGGLARIAG